MVKEVAGRFDVEGWAARDESDILSPFNFTRRVGLGLPRIKVCYQQLSVEVDVYVGSRVLPTLPNSILNMTEVASYLPEKEETIVHSRRHKWHHQIWKIDTSARIAQLRENNFTLNFGQKTRRGGL